MFFRLSETARAVIWLWDNDRANWRIGSHATVHQPTGLGIWTSNACYGLSLFYDIPEQDRFNCHPCNGRQVKLNRRDRHAIYKLAVQGQSLSAHREIQRQVSDWAADKIRNKVPTETHQPHLTK